MRQYESIGKIHTGACFPEPTTGYVTFRETMSIDVAEWLQSYVRHHQNYRLDDFLTSSESASNIF